MSRKACPQCASRATKLLSADTGFNECQLCGHVYLTPVRKRVMKNPSYRQAIEYIALNDEPDDLNPEFMTGMASVHLVSVIFGTPTEVVAADVVRYRLKEKACILTTPSV